MDQRTNRSSQGTSEEMSWLVGEQERYHQGIRKFRAEYASFGKSEGGGFGYHQRADPKIRCFPRRSSQQLHEGDLLKVETLLGKPGKVAIRQELWRTDKTVCQYAGNQPVLCVDPV